MLFWKIKTYFYSYCITDNFKVTYYVSENDCQFGTWIPHLSSLSLNFKTSCFLHSYAFQCCVLLGYIIVRDTEYYLQCRGILLNSSFFAHCSDHRTVSSMVVIYEGSKFISFPLGVKCVLWWSFRDKCHMYERFEMARQKIWWQFWYPC